MPHSIDHYGFVGSSHRLVGFERLGQMVLPADEPEARSALRAALGARELLYVATCNRVECYVALAEPASAERLRDRLREFFAARGLRVQPEEVAALTGSDAARHAFEVTAALDSLVVGETEINGQIRRAFAAACADGLIGPALRTLHDEAQACARRVRSQTAIGELATSVGSVAVRKVFERFSAAGPRVSALIGVGPMTVKAARALARFPGERLFVNRTLARAEELAREFGGRALPLERFLSDVPAELDLLWTATAAPDVIVPREALLPVLEARAADRQLVVCDLGVPRDVDVRLAEHPSVRLVSMTELQQAARKDREALAATIEEARAIVGEAIDRLEREQRFVALAHTSASALVSSRLAHIAGSDQAALVRFAEQLAARLARQPGRLVTAESLSPGRVTSL